MHKSRSPRPGTQGKASSPAHPPAPPSSKKCSNPQLEGWGGVAGQARGRAVRCVLRRRQRRRTQKTPIWGRQLLMKLRAVIGLSSGSSCTRTCRQRRRVRPDGCAVAATEAEEVEAQLAVRVGRWVGGGENAQPNGPSSVLATPSSCARSVAPQSVGSTHSLAGCGGAAAVAASRRRASVRAHPLRQRLAQHVVGFHGRHCQQHRHLLIVLLRVSERAGVAMTARLEAWRIWRCAGRGR